MDIYKLNGKFTVATDMPAEEWEKFISSKNILPRPVIRDDNGKFTKYYLPRDWFLKLQEEVFEVQRETNLNEVKYGHILYIAEEIADVITVCISYLNALGYDEKKRSEIFRRVNEKNEKRGYFKNT